LDAVSAGLRSETALVCDIPSNSLRNDKTEVKIGYRAFEQNTVFPAHSVYIITYVICIAGPTRVTKGVMAE